MYKNFHVYILTYNDELMIGNILSDLIDVEKVTVVDSYSTDRTSEIVDSFGRQFVEHDFENQAIQSNWLVNNYLNNERWVVRFDSDERISSNLLREIEELTLQHSPMVGYIHREMYWMGKKLNFSGLRKHFIGRIYQPSSAKFEEVTEEHLIHECESIFLKTSFYENNYKNTIEHFIYKHLDTARGEVRELRDSPEMEKKGRLSFRHAHLTRRWIKCHLYNKLPIFVRPTIYFIYRYFIKFGFLDGKAGFSFCFFQAFFYRMLIDQLLSEEKINDD